jgi:hypothetical protein
MKLEVLESIQPLCNKAQEELEQAISSVIQGVPGAGEQLDPTLEGLISGEKGNGAVIRDVTLMRTCGITSEGDRNGTKIKPEQYQNTTKIAALAHLFYVQNTLIKADDPQREILFKAANHLIASISPFEYRRCLETKNNMPHDSTLQSQWFKTQQTGAQVIIPDTEKLRVAELEKRVAGVKNNLFKLAKEQYHATKIFGESPPEETQHRLDHKNMIANPTEQYSLRKEEGKRCLVWDEFMNSGFNIDSPLCDSLNAAVEISGSEYLNQLGSGSFGYLLKIKEDIDCLKEDGQAKLREDITNHRVGNLVFIAFFRNELARSSGDAQKLLDNIASEAPNVDDALSMLNTYIQSGSLTNHFKTMVDSGTHSTGYIGDSEYISSDINDRLRKLRENIMEDMRKTVNHLPKDSSE